VRVGFVTAERAPLAHVGGLGDVSRWLPETLAAGGDEVTVFLPHYDWIEGARILGESEVAPFGSVTLAVAGEPGDGAPTVCLIGHEAFEGDRVYRAGPDEHLRYAMFTAAVPAACRSLGWVPEVFHANDWHTALLPVQAAAAGAPWDRVPVVLTIHNLAFQGVFPAADLAVMGLDAAVADGDEFNALATGIRTAAVVTTVSPTYAAEITTPERGEGLHRLLASRADDLVGILNGIGPDWDPSRDEHLPHRYDTPEGKAPNRAALANRFSFESGDAPVLGVVSRLTAQKGFGLLPPVLTPLLERGAVRLAVVGTGDPAVEVAFSDLVARFPGRVGFEPGFDTPLGHLIEAGSDLFLMPSRFEPCGLNQMYSMRYGTPPVVHRTGGLADTVEQWDPERRTGTGFLFDEFTPAALAAALDDALATYRDRDGWRTLMSNGMARDFSWEARAVEYRSVYARALSRRRGGQGR
jgi:starch synthase